MGKLVGRIWVGFTTSLICFLAYSSQIFVIWPWYGRELSIDLLTLLVPFNMFVGMLLWNYSLCVRTNPGSVPEYWQPITEPGEGYEVKANGKPRFCRTCNRHKPPRTHHCSQCKRCVLRMDHHCPWVDNCVGHYNYGHFLRFLFFVDVSCIYLLVMLTRRTLDAMNAPYWRGPDGVEMTLLILNFMFCIPVTMAVGGFSLYHFYCLCTNTTTIESWEKDKVATLIRRGKIQEVKFPYNIGTERNIKSVLGHNPLYWCWPTKPPGDGTEYQVSSGIGMHAQHSWPPQDPTAHHRPDYTHPAHDDDDELSTDSRFAQDSSPWTFQTGSLNPSLEPSNSSHLHQRLSRKDKKPNEEQTTRASSTSSDEYRYNYDNMSDAQRRRVRRGSEGYEIKAMDREEILRRYILSRGEEVGYYERYVPEPEIPREEESDCAEDELEDLEINLDSADRASDLDMEMAMADDGAEGVSIDPEDSSACEDDDNIPLARRKGYKFVDNI